jgi:hypothetical protein
VLCALSGELSYPNREHVLIEDTRDNFREYVSEELMEYLDKCQKPGDILNDLARSGRQTRVRGQKRKAPPDVSKCRVCARLYIGRACTHTDMNQMQDVTDSCEPCAWSQ